jgi:glycosyltransferase involved in cell wall biosynthesis
MAIKIIAGKPAWATRWESADYTDVIRGLAENWRPDIVHIDYPVMAQYVSALRSLAAPRVLVDHDPTIYTLRERMAVRRGFHRITAWLNEWAWRRFARRALRSVHTVVALTKRDRDLIERLGTTTPIATIPLATIVPAIEADPQWASGTVLFVGNFMHPPNTDAALRLARDILPMVKRHVSGTRLVIVGAGPGQELRDLTGPDVQITGWVPDVYAYLQSASVFVVPVRLGGGMRVKVLEALAAGTAVVASGLAVEGLDVRDQQEVAIAETDEQFATAIVELLKDARKRAALGRRARAWALNALSWKQVTAAYSNLYEDLLATHAAFPRR